MSEERARIYTDGSAHYKTGYGAWAFIAVTGDTVVHEAAGAEESTTNNRMELSAICEAVSYTLNKPAGCSKFEVITDSQYACNGLNDWRKGWKLKHWKNVKNFDLWQSLDRVVDALPGFGLWVTFSWVKGHAGDKFNERVDKLAHAAFQRLTDAKSAADTVHKR